jgi:Ner family transcriptional regulator
MHHDRSADKAAKLRLDEMTRIKGLLLKAGISLRDVDREYNLSRGIAGITLRQPNIGGERAIAAALGRRPEHLWRTRYHADGRRLSPQPAANYDRLPSMQERKAEAAESQEAA